MDPQPPPNKPPRAARLLSIAACVVAAVIVLTVFVGHGLARGPVIDVFDDFDTDLPAITIWALQVPAPVSISLGLLVTLFLLAKETLVSNARATATINLSIAFVALVLGCVVAAAFTLPMVKSMQSLM